DSVHRHDHHGHRRDVHRRRIPDRPPGTARLDRHAPRLRDRMRRRSRPAEAQPGPAAPLRAAVGPLRPGRRHPGLRIHDVRIAARHVVAPADLDGHRTGHLLLLRSPPLEACGGEELSATNPTRSTDDPNGVPEGRRSAIERLAAELHRGDRVALFTHINADGDGCGSEVALARLLAQMGIAAHIVNPTPWPSMFDYLLGDDVRDRSPEGAKALAGIDRLIVLDISEARRLGSLADVVRKLPLPPLVIDHHLPGEEPLGTLRVADVTAGATGELVFDFAMVKRLEITPAIAMALYTAILTDTGGFRYSNTSPRYHAVASRLLA